MWWSQSRIGKGLWLEQGDVGWVSTDLGGPLYIIELVNLATGSPLICKQYRSEKLWTLAGMRYRRILSRREAVVQEPGRWTCLHIFVLRPPEAAMQYLRAFFEFGAVASPSDQHRLIDQRED